MSGPSDTKKARVDFAGNLSEAIKINNVGAVTSVLERSNGDVTLPEAFFTCIDEFERSEEIMKALIGNDRFTDLNVNMEDNQGRTPLLKACHLAGTRNYNVKISLDMINILLGSKRVQKRCTSSVRGNSALSEALIGGSSKDLGCLKSICELLLQNEPELINLQNKEGMAPFMIACRDVDSSICKFLLSYPKIKIDQADNAKNTALHYAARRKDAVQLIQAFHECLDYKLFLCEDSEGKTPLKICPALSGIYNSRRKVAEADLISKEKAFSMSVPCAYETTETLYKACIAKKALLFEGLSGTGKSHFARSFAKILLLRFCFENNILPSERHKVTFVSFSESYAYEDFIGGFRPSLLQKGMYELQAGLFLRHLGVSNLQSDDIESQIDDVPSVMIIDEINRANAPEVLGELMSLMEQRGKSDPVELRCGRRLNLPKNCFVIATMNGYDRSLKPFSRALLERFMTFEFPLPPPDQKLIFDFNSDKKRRTQLIDIMRKIISSDFRLCTVDIPLSLLQSKGSGTVTESENALRIRLALKGVLTERKLCSIQSGESFGHKLCNALAAVNLLLLYLEPQNTPFYGHARLIGESTDAQKFEEHAKLIWNHSLFPMIRQLLRSRVHHLDLDLFQLDCWLDVQV